MRYTGTDKGESPPKFIIALLYKIFNNNKENLASTKS